MALLLAGVSAISLVVALLAVRRERAVAGELTSMRHQLRDLASRLAAAEKSAEEASSRAEAAGNVLLEKGLANVEDLQASRGLDAFEVAQPVRGSRTLH